MGGHATQIPEFKLKVLFFCPINPKRPTGGVLVIFRAVEILRRSGIDACVANLSEEGQNEQPNIGWFTSSAPIISWGQACQISADECVFVLPEDYCMAWKQDQITTTRGVLQLYKAHVVLMAQNRRDMYRNLSSSWPALVKRQETILAHPKFLGVLCVSNLEKTYWGLIYPDLQIWCKPNSVDTEFFKPASQKENIATFIAKPGPPQVEAKHMLLALRHSGLAANWRLANLQGKSQAEVAQIMGRADLFLSFGVMESFGLAAAEAMASGCIVIGYHGGVAEEFFNPRWSYPVPPLDYLGYLQAFQQLLQDRERCPSLIDQKRQWGRQHIERNFSPTHEAQALLGIFSEILETTKT